MLHVNPATGPEIIVFGGVGPNPEETKDIPLTDTWAFRVDAHEWVKLETTGKVWCTTTVALTSAEYFTSSCARRRLPVGQATQPLCATGRCGCSEAQAKRPF